MNFSADLRRLRLEAGLSQRQLAMAAGVDMSYVSKLENGRVAHTPSAKTLSALARALGVQELDLLERAGKLPPELAGQPEAVAVLRAAGQRIPSAAGWRKLLEYVESPDFERELDALDRAAGVKR
jgi:transcriptional regulator with XRE-family HTH domain